MRPVTRFAAISLLFIACARAGDSSWTTVRSTSGDTTIVRTTGRDPSAGVQTLSVEWSVGSLQGPEETTFGDIAEVVLLPDGGLLLYDGQVRVLRVYDSTGTFVRTIGGSGSGPGEYTHSNGAAVRSDGSVVMWDAGNARINVYDARGEYVTQWTVPTTGRYFTGRAVVAGPGGAVLLRTRVVNTPSGLSAEERFRYPTTGMMRFSSDGTAVDSLTPPPTDIEAALLIASVGGATSVSDIPFARRYLWRYSPLGYFVTAASDDYSIILHREGAPVKVQRELPRVALDPDERQDALDRSSADMRAQDPAWRWTGPEIPHEKPYFNSMDIDGDGRIWMRVHVTGERIPEEELVERRAGVVLTDEMPEPPLLPPIRWREQTVYDVFAATGEFLGRVPMPSGVTWYAASGNVILAEERGEDGVPRLLRMRLSPGLSAQRGGEQN